MMICCFLFSVACMPLLAPLLRRLGPLFPAVSMKPARLSADGAQSVSCCAGGPAIQIVPTFQVTRAGVVLWVAGFAAVVSGCYQMLTPDEPLSDAMLWALALHDAWCLPAR